jgi:ribosome biogenesis GTPase
MLGSSGAGKSTIVNTLVGEDVLPTRDVRESDSRGRHTSTSRQMVVLPGGGGLLIDTPGMRELQLWDAGGLTGSFTDITDLAGACRFRDCRHTGEPGCAVAAAVAAGTLPAARLGSYLKLAAEQGFAARQQDERERLEAKRRARVAGKALAKRLKERDQS